MAQDNNGKSTNHTAHIQDWDNGSKPPKRHHPAPKIQTRRAKSDEKVKRSDKGKPQPRGSVVERKETRDASKGDGARRKRAIVNPRELVVETLVRLENGGYSNIVWDLAVKHANLNALDKMLATRIFYGTLSNLRLIDALWCKIEPEMVKRADPIVKMTLRSAMYQLVFLDRVPPYSIVSTSVDVVKRLRNRAASGYCNALLRKAVACKENHALVYQSTGDKLHDFAVQYSLNDDLAKRLLDEFPDDAQSIAESMLTIPRMVLRVNRSKISMDDFLLSAQCPVERSDKLPESACIALQRHANIDEALDRGDICVQDEAAQLAVAALGPVVSWAPESDDVHIWDACAGLGGKSIHILDEIAAAHSDRKFALLSTDLYANKLERLKDYQQKYFPEALLVTKPRDLTVPGSVQLAPFDLILVDAPCSGLGVLRRHPEIKLSRTGADIDALAALQKQILDNVSRHLRIGGILLYAVCTLTHAECENQVEAFLNRHSNFALDALPEVCHAPNGAAQLRLMPHSDGCDGFFIARLKRMA